VHDGEVGEPVQGAPAARGALLNFDRSSHWLLVSHAGGCPFRGTPGSTRYAGGLAGEAATVTVIVGTSGWQYRDWRGRFYPPRLPQRLWLEH
jgi:hypothetical protein